MATARTGDDCLEVSPASRRHLPYTAARTLERSPRILGSSGSSAGSSTPELTFLQAFGRPGVDPVWTSSHILAVSTTPPLQRPAWHVKNPCRRPNAILIDEPEGIFPLRLAVGPTCPHCVEFGAHLVIEHLLRPEKPRPCAGMHHISSYPLRFARTSAKIAWRICSGRECHWS